MAGAAVSSSSSGYAGEPPAAKLTISGEFGRFFPGGAETLKAAPLMGFKVGTSVTELMEIEGGLAFIPSAAGGAASEIAQAQFELLYRAYLYGPLRLYGVAGFGGIFGSGGAKSGAMIDFGVGAKLFLAPRFALRADFRDVIAVQSAGNNLEFSIGVTYLFQSGSTGAEASSLDRRKSMGHEAEASPPAAPDKAALAAPSALSLYFEADSSQLSNEHLASLDAIADGLQLSADVAAVVEAHAAGQGEESYNYTLSRLRAESVKRYLLKRGVQAQRLSLSAPGPVPPVAGNPGKQGGKGNDRGVVKVSMYRRDGAGR